MHGSTDTEQREQQEHEHLMVALATLGERIPCARQFVVDLDLARAIADIRSFFAEHDLPTTAEPVGRLLAELDAWRTRAAPNLTSAERCDDLMSRIIALANETRRPRP